MKEFDFGYFGTGDEGFAQYMTAFDRIFDTKDTDSDFSVENDFDVDDSDADF